MVESVFQDAGEGLMQEKEHWSGDVVFSKGISFCLLCAFFILFLSTEIARADDDFSCDSLTSVTPQEGTVWSWFEHPCPPQPGEESPAILPGVGVTLQGFWIPTTLYNPTGTPVSPSLPLINSSVENGYGGGIEITGWLAANLAVRFQADLWTFPPQTGASAFTMLPILLGFEVKVLGNSRIYLYLAGDGGVALNGQDVANAFVGTGTSPYAQASVGLNVYAFQVEAGYGVLLDPTLTGSAKAPGGSSNPFFIVPLTIGFHL